MPGASVLSEAGGKHTGRSGIARLVVLLLFVLLAAASGVGYLVLEAEIAAGERDLAAGQKQLREGRSELEEGKAELKAGEQALTEGKKEYEQASRNPFLLLLDKLVNQNKGFREGREEIAAGEQEVAEGQSAVSAGERRVEAGVIEISQGREQLRLARWLQSACAIMGAVSALLAVVLGLCWRRSLVRVFARADAG